MRFKNKSKGHTGQPVENLREMVRCAAQKHGNKTLYAYKEGRETALYSYTRLWDEMNAIGAALEKRSLSDCGVAVTGALRPRWMASFLAVVNGGGYAVPLDAEITPHETRNFLERSEARAVFYTASQNSKIASIAPKMESVELFVPIDPEGDFRFSDRVVTIDELIAEGQALLDAGDRSYIERDIDTEKICFLLFTSGTTGTSKGVMLSQRNFTADINASVEAMPLEDGITSFSVLPPHHSYELTCELLAGISAGAETFINDSLKNLKRNLLVYKPRGMVLVPVIIETLYKRIWAEAKKSGQDKKLRFAVRLSNALLFFGIDRREKLFQPVLAAMGGRMEMIISGGAPLSPQLVRDLYAFGITVYEGYGITECSPLVSVNTPENIRLRSVGRPVGCCEVKISEENREGKVGEILVKGDNVMLGYYKDPQATREAFTPDGWFKTGDVGYLDRDGFLYITGREKNIIIMGNGKNVYPEELEEHLGKVELIEECVVLEREKDSTPVIIALVVPNEELTEGMSDREIYDAVKAEVEKVNQHLPSYKYIYDVEIRREKFERNTSRKIIRHKLK